VDVKAIPGQEHLPWAEVHFEVIDDDRWRAASAAARDLGKTGLEAWTTEETPAVIDFLVERGYGEVRRYLLLELDVQAAPDPGAPGWELTTLADRPDLLEQVYEIAVETVGDQPGREGTSFGGIDVWRGFAYEPNPKDAFFVALDDGRPVGFGHLKVDGDVGWHAMTATARAWRGRGIAEAVKRAHIRWAKANGLRVLRTANETRIAAIRRLNDRYGYTQTNAEVVLRGPLASLD
jgi:GNAT superfamily N-acetyltransferase